MIVQIEITDADLAILKYEIADPEQWLKDALAGRIDHSKTLLTNVAIEQIKAGAIDFLLLGDDAVLRDKLGTILAECFASVRPATRNEEASAHIARLTPRERDVLVGLVDGGTNKIIAQQLGISPRTVELHRSQVMSKLGAGSLTELGQIALAAGIAPSGASGKTRKHP